MIFGKTVEQRNAEESEAARKAIFGIKKFAWFPTQLTDGRGVWLTHYYEYHDGTLKYDQYSLNTNVRRYLEPSNRRVVLYKNHYVMDIESLEKLIKDGTSTV